MNIILSIVEGSKYKYRNFTWEGMTLFNQEKLQTSTPELVVYIDGHI